jgi:Putative porin
MSRFKALKVAATVALVFAGGVAHAADTERQSLEELRNTVVNLLQTLVEQKVMTRDQAEALVKSAQDQAQKTAQETEKRDAGAVRVPYVPQIVRDQIRQEVEAELRPAVVKDVVAEAKQQGWGVPAGLPDWLSGVRVVGDLRVRAQEDLYPSGNQANTIPDFQAINAAGSITKPGLSAFLDTAENRTRLRIRARLGVEAQLPADFSAGLRLATGSALDPASESQTLGTSAARYGVALDLAYLRWEPKTSDGFHPVTASAGRIASPWFTPTELVFGRDLTFEGVAGTFRHSLKAFDQDGSNVYATVGAFPMQEVALNRSGSKWLLGAQFGTRFDWSGGDKIRAAAAYYDYLHVTGVRNVAGSSVLNYTAPAFVRYGNSMYDIQNDPNQSAYLFGLASKFRLVNVAASYEHPMGDKTLVVTGDVVKNVGFNAADILSRTGLALNDRSRGYVAEVAYGDLDASTRAGAWRVAFGYRYVQGDAVLDAWTDTDFHGGGTNSRGYYLTGNYGIAKNVWAQLRYLKGDVIDLPPPFLYGLDTVQLDLNARF